MTKEVTIKQAQFGITLLLLLCSWLFCRGFQGVLSVKQDNPQ